MSGGAPASNQPAPKPSAPTASAGKPSGLDRWKLKPVGPGYLRGQIRNIRRSEDISRFGTLRVVEFDLDRGGGLPPVPVEMRGLYFNRDVPEGRVCDVADPTPHIRPLVTGLITFPQAPGQSVTTFNMDAEALARRRFWSWSLLVPLIPVAVIALLAWLLARHLHG